MAENSSKIDIDSLKNLPQDLNIDSKTVITILTTFLIKKETLENVSIDKKRKMFELKTSFLNSESASINKNDTQEKLFAFLKLPNAY